MIKIVKLINMSSYQKLKSENELLRAELKALKASQSIAINSGLHFAITLVTHGEALEDDLHPGLVETLKTRLINNGIYIKRST